MTNAEMVQAIDVMVGLSETGKLGYAIARNLRLLKTEATEYIQLRSELFQKYGIQNGSQWRIPPENIEEYIKELGDIPSIDHEVNVFKVSEEDFVSGSLTAAQMESLLWMVKED
ncbi:MAG: hypothetical protein LUD72_11415 [Bacteroidales bacterium]|nr:hypothetical protein [Bacteroidales bacterium]